MVKQRSVGGREQAAIVGRNADGCVAPVNDAGQIGNPAPNLGCSYRKRITAPHAITDFEPLWPEGIIIIAIGVDRQQIAVFCIKQEQQPIEQDQRRVAHFLQRRLGRCPRNRRSQCREDFIENELGQRLGNALFIESSFGPRAFVKGSAIGTSSSERGA